MHGRELWCRIQHTIEEMRCTASYLFACNRLAIRPTHRQDALLPNWGSPFAYVVFPVFLHRAMPTNARNVIDQKSKNDLWAINPIRFGATRTRKADLYLTSNNSTRCKAVLRSRPGPDLEILAPGLTPRDTGSLSWPHRTMLLDCWGRIFVPENTAQRMWA